MLTQARSQPGSSALASSVLAVAAALVLGTLVSLASPGPFVTSVVVFAGCTVLIETLRKKSDPVVPWWAAHVALVPWAAIVLVPWAYFANKGHWFILTVPIDPSLSRTWTVHLAALIGITLGSVFAVLQRRPPRYFEAGAVNWRRISTAIGVAVALYFVSFVVASRPLAALWRLSGDVRYFDNADEATGLGALDYMTTVATGLLLVAAAVRRRSTVYPPLTELAWLIVLSVLTLGSGARGRFYLVLMGWIIVQVRPFFARGTAASRVVLSAMGAAVLMLALSLAGTISVARARGAGIERGSSVQTAFQGLDVIGSGELLAIRGPTAGVLNGQSYSELPRLLIPRRFAGVKSNPAADELVRRRLDPTAGFSAPLWLEPMLNFGKWAVLLFSAGYAWLAVWVLRSSVDRVGSRFSACLTSLGPVWILVSYLALSRLTILQLMLTLGSVLVGIYAASRCVQMLREYNPV